MVSHPRRRRTDREPNRGWIPALGLTGMVALLDWGSKALVSSRIPEGGFAEVWEGRVALWHVRNPEMILGLWGGLPLAGRQAIAAVAAVLAVVLLAQVTRRAHRLLPHRRPWGWLFVGLAAGGMLGNLGERALHWEVTDFLSLAWGGIWLPPGNLADIALFLSIPVAAVVAAFEMEARSLRRRGGAAAPVAGESSRTLSSGGV